MKAASTVTARHFGPAAAPLLGWLHAPAATGAPRLGLVLCNPFGFEAVCAHRSLRAIADAAAAAGVPSLRFDYAGTGDAPGDEFGAPLPEAAQQSIDAAVEHLKAATGVRRVVLLGMRLGAAFASIAAAERDDVAALVAIAPVVKGRAHLRELRVLGPAGAAHPQAALESAGFAMSAATVEALGRLDLMRATRAPAPRVLIVDRDDLPGGAEAWAATLAQHGASVEAPDWPGYAEMMVDPQRTRVPEAIVQGVVGLLAAWQATAEPGIAIAAPATASPALVADGVVETAVRIGHGSATLWGVVTKRARAAAAQPRGVLMLNSGAVPHIGPNRLWVTLARRWAARGVTVLRLDLSGIGESPARAGRPENVVYSAEAMRDVAAAVEHLRAVEGVGECHVLGLCSGAYHAFRAAAKNLGLASAVMINPLTYRWNHDAPAGGGLAAYEVLELSAGYRRRVLTAEPWKRLVRGELDLGVISNVLARRIAGWRAHTGQQLKRRIGIAPADAVDTTLARAAAQHVRLHFVFAEGHAGHGLLLREARATVRRLQARRALSIDFIAGADHTFTRLDARERLITQLDALMFAPAGQGAPSAEAKRLTDETAARTPRRSPA